MVRPRASAPPETSNHRTGTDTAIGWWSPPATAAYGRADRVSVPPRRRTTEQLRNAWARYRCAERDMVTIGMVGHRVQINPRAVDAFTALSQALLRTGYGARRTGGYSCRPIAGTNRFSLHSYGIAVDI